MNRRGRWAFSASGVRAGRPLEYGTLEVRSLEYGSLEFRPLVYPLDVGWSLISGRGQGGSEMQGSRDIRSFWREAFFRVRAGRLRKRLAAPEPISLAGGSVWRPDVLK